MHSLLSSAGVSICIPTFRRPALLRECLLSTFKNALRPLEVIVSDHDFSEESKATLRAIEVPEGITLRHVAGPAVRTQSANVNSLLALAVHERLMILHDDDMLTEGAVDRLASAWDAENGELDAVYGRQYISDGDGTIDHDKTAVNGKYYYKDFPAGPQPSNLWAALVAQFPNDGMMMRKSVALQCGYPSEAEVGRIPVDFHFGIRYAIASTRPFVLLHDYTAIYRMSSDSVLRSRKRSFDGQLGYQQLERLAGLTPLEESARSVALQRFAGSAVMGYLATGEPVRAASVLRRHLFHMDKSWPVRLGLIALVSLERAGVPVLRKAGVAGRQT